MENIGFRGEREQVDAVLRAADVLLRVAATSVVEIEDVVTTPQLRVLVLIAFQGPQNLGAVARELGVHASNATRTCERLVVAGLLSRREDPSDRRFLQLDLTAKGRDLVETMIEHRRRAIADVLERVPADSREALASAMSAFADAGGGQGTDDGRFTLGLGS
ncbi:MarR family winged helix-turn-helix transcriptional regulator [Sinomonas terrae]|uniref:MarR family transcriptional regulator n=1 Tax=Sinomonas terrae TaxID=2908838 RepID=A0ABS9U2E9_9MICC|nr:MarR family transcriptional regulator [Sinomonas terrae]MCH6470828.1 MarR family transcriptional regulator [Sinomonas terrae]